MAELRWGPRVAPAPSPFPVTLTACHVMDKEKHSTKILNVSHCVYDPQEPERLSLVVLIGTLMQ